MTTSAPPQAPPQQQDQDQRLALQIAAVLAAATTVAAAMAAIAALLRPFGIAYQSMAAALQIVMGMPADRYGVQGPATLSMQRLNQLRRAQFAVQAARRLMADEVLASAHGQDPDAALRAGYTRENRYYGLHLQAIWNREKAAAQVDDAARSHGLLLGWYTVLDSHTSPECRAANRHNFRADAMPLIGYPGAVHPHCRCYPGAPYRFASMLPSAAGARAA